MNKVYTLLAATSVMACSAAQLGLIIDGQVIINKDELSDYVVAGCPELTIPSIQHAIDTAVTTESLTDEQKKETTLQYVMHYVELMTQRCLCEVLVMVDARDNGQISEIIFAQRLPFVAAFQQQIVSHIREEMAQLSEAQIAEMKQTLATAHKVDVATVSLQDIETALLNQEYIGAMKRIADRHRIELSEGVLEPIVEAIMATVQNA